MGAVFAHLPQLHLGRLAISDGTHSRIDPDFHGATFSWPRLVPTPATRRDNKSGSSCRVIDARVGG
jgi:hypothetical protein